MLLRGKGVLGIPRPHKLPLLFTLLQASAGIQPRCAERLLPSVGLGPCTVALRWVWSSMAFVRYVTASPCEYGWNLRPVGVELSHGRAAGSELDMTGPGPAQVPTLLSLAHCVIGCCLALQDVRTVG